MIRDASWRLAATAALGLACSTVAPSEVVSCTKDEDCKKPGQVCQSGECYDNTLPLPSQVGLDVNSESLEGVFRVELQGDDKIVERVVEEKPARFRVHYNNKSIDAETTIPGARDKLSLTIVERTDALADDPLKDLPPIAASLALEQASRLRRDPVRSEGRFAPYDPEGNELLDAEVILPWARYDPADADYPLHLTIRADDTMVDASTEVIRGPIHRQLVRVETGKASTQRFRVPTRQECHRKLVGNVIVGDGVPLDARVTVEFLHTHSVPDAGKSVCDPSTTVQAVCEPSTIYPNELPPCTTANDCPAPYGCYPAGSAKKCGCSRDSECHTGQICELESHRCAFDLAGLVATTGAVATKDDEPSFDAWIYSYCDEEVEADREMAFLLRATSVGLDDGDEMTPLPASRLPPLTFAAVANVPADDTDTHYLPGSLCFPDWQAARALDVTLTSAPQEVFRDESDRPWICCSTDCVATMLSEPPPPPDSCPVVGDLTARTLYTQDPALKAEHNCLELVVQDPELDPDTQWITGDSTELGACLDEGGNPTTCTISLTQGILSLNYEVRLEPAVGSLVRSTIFNATVKGETMALPSPELSYRVLLRGGVALEVNADPDDDELICTDLTQCEVKAEILAERIRVPGEDPATVIGPYFYATRTIEGSSTGEFVLPVNPGVYLLTALPAISSIGGPAKISVVDLRLDSPLVNADGEIPFATLAEPLLLSQKGQFVIFELAGFDLASVAAPFDLGSWVGLTFEGRELDLNDPTTCHGDSGRACSIRRLRAGNSGLALTQEQFAKFITR